MWYRFFYLILPGPPRGSRGPANWKKDSSSAASRGNGFFLHHFDSFQKETKTSKKWEQDLGEKLPLAGPATRPPRGPLGFPLGKFGPATVKPPRGLKCQTVNTACKQKQPRKSQTTKTRRPDSARPKVAHHTAHGNTVNPSPKDNTLQKYDPLRDIRGK